MLNFKWLKNHKGQGMVEYILIIAVVVGIIFGVYKLMGGKVKEQFQNAADTIETATEE
ncbi:MAG: Flp family type IVb pilin [Elusimicrobiota bacterium]|jgi:Flp pilus assembly pilin Flp|nr:Flp family type IVb pilin [Elusimicrobiota bacterium]